ncbi:ABC transporter ATP-binding protein [Propioniciclava soli]|uniref:ATP-binding cassette domain-containing protein n=1 Tax=Propioniciclava soli TaxID=2775081 RepID=A0ABZ3C9A6_9ACTN|nr:ATP-binding cassette domain-containing protein [Propioniciclava soli]
MQASRSEGASDPAERDAHRPDIGGDAHDRDAHAHDRDAHAHDRDAHDRHLVGPNDHDPGVPDAEDPGQHAIVIRGLRKTYRRGRVAAVSDLDLTVPRGGVHAFLGPNGSGKTTTLRMLLGLTRADAGTMTILGTPVPDGLPDVIDRVGAIVEQPKLFPTMSGRDNLVVLGRGIGLPRQRVDAVIDQVGLGPRAKDLVHGYSLGMRQRLAIAATLLKDPEVLIFDEPTNGLDPAGMHEVRVTLRGLAEAGRTVVISSHLLAEVQQVADTVSIIGRGRLLREGTVAELLTSSGRVQVRVRPVEDAARALTDAGYMVALDGSDRVTVSHPDAAPRPDAIARTLGEAGLWPTELIRATPSLEDVFLALTAREHLTATSGQGIVFPGDPSGAREGAA